MDLSIDFGKITPPPIPAHLNVSSGLMRVSPSRVGVYQDCPLKFDLIYRKGLSKKGSTVFFDLGNYIHELMHVAYQMKKEIPGVSSDFIIASIVRRIQNDLDASNDLSKVSIYHRAINIVTRFFKYQSPKIDRGIAVVDIEWEYDVPVTLPSGRVVNLYGFIDLIYRDRRSRLVVRDHKSGANPSSFSDKITEADNQLLTYGAVAYLIYGEAPIVEFSYLNTHEYKTPPDVEKQFKLFRVETHTETVYKNHLADTLQLIDEMLDSKPTPHYSRSCSSCLFWDVCRLRRKGVSVDNVLKSNYDTRDPNQPRGSISFTQNDTNSNPTN